MRNGAQFAVCMAAQARRGDRNILCRQTTRITSNVLIARNWPSLGSNWHILAFFLFLYVP